MISSRLSVLVTVSLALFTVARSNAPAPQPSPFCCPKTQQSNDFTPHSINFVSASLKSDDPNILKCMYQGDQGTYCEYTLIPRDYVSFKYKAGELKTQGAARCSNNAVPAPSSPKEASNQGLACAPTLCCPLTQDSNDPKPQTRKLKEASYRVEQVSNIPQEHTLDNSPPQGPTETVLECSYESASCTYRLNGELKTVSGSLCHNPAVMDVSTNGNCAKPL